MRIFTLGESALTIEFGNEISREMNEKALSVARHFQQYPFPGFVEAVPAYSSVTIFYDVVKVRESLAEFGSAFAAVQHLANAAIQNASGEFHSNARVVEIPVLIDGETALDLKTLAEFSGLSAEEVIDIFLSKNYRVYMLGFLPGFAYMGEVDERIAAPRLETPRTKVPKGSVGIAGKQTGIYPLESPGGWRIIGRTDVEMFDPKVAEPCLLRPGDQVRFVRLGISGR